MSEEIQSRQTVPFWCPDRYAAVVVAVVSTGYGYYVSTLEKAMSSDVVGPSFFPTILSFSGLLLATLLFYSPDRDGSKGAMISGHGLSLRAQDFIPIGMLLLYVIIIFQIGFAISTILYLFASMVFFRERNKLAGLIWSCILMAAVYVLFNYALDVPLPIGRLFGGYQ